MHPRGDHSNAGWWRWVPLLVVVLHTVAITIAGVAGWAGWHRPAPFYDDLFTPYLFISGPISFYLSYVLSRAFYGPCVGAFPLRVASILVIYVLPGLFNAVLGGLQWFVIAKITISFRRRRSDPDSEKGSA